MCLAVFSYFLGQYIYPRIDLNETGTELKGSDLNGSDSERSLFNSTSIKNALNREPVESDETSFESTLIENDGGASTFEDKPLNLDLSLPYDGLDPFEDTDAPAAQLSRNKYDNTLPDLFSDPIESNNKDSRTSIGGRLLLDEDNPNYTMDAVLGAEVSVELKTH